MLSREELSLLDGDRKLSKNGQRTDGSGPKKNLQAKKNINTAYARRDGVKQRTST
jgi:predicted FMN-binding regulatory protein PaiB